LVIDACVHVAALTYGLELALLLLLDQSHVVRIATRNEIAQRCFLEVAEPQRRIDVTARTAVHDAGCHYLDGGEQAHAGAVLVDEVGADDVDGQPAHVVIGDVAAPVVVDALRDLDGDCGPTQLLDQPRDLAGPAAQGRDAGVDGELTRKPATVVLAEESLDIVDQPAVYLLGRLRDVHEGLRVITVDADRKIAELCE